MKKRKPPKQSVSSETAWKSPKKRSKGRKSAIWGKKLSLFLLIIARKIFFAREKKEKVRNFFKF